MHAILLVDELDQLARAGIAIVQAFALHRESEYRQLGFGNEFNLRQLIDTCLYPVRKVEFLIQTISKNIHAVHLHRQPHTQTAKRTCELRRYLAKIDNLVRVLQIRQIVSGRAVGRLQMLPVANQ